MTHTKATCKRKRCTRRALNAADLLVGFFLLFCLLLLLKNSDAAIRFMSAGLLTCATTVIPALFPFAVLAEWISSGSPFRRGLSRIFAPLGRLLALSEDGLCALLLGMLCGFPIGTRCAVNAYREGRIEREEAERVIGIACPPSSGFLIGAVGTMLLGDKKFGVRLYFAVLLSAAIVALFLRFLRQRRTDSVSCTIPCTSCPRPLIPMAKRFTDAVGAATQGMLTVCAYVVFFSTLIGALGLILKPLGLPDQLSAILFSLLELSSGARHAAALTSPTSARLICALAAGWSGLSVHCQTLSFCAGTDLSLRTYFLAKLLQGLLTPLLVWMIG